MTQNEYIQANYAIKHRNRLKAMKKRDLYNLAKDVQDVPGIKETAKPDLINIILMSRFGKNILKTIDAAKKV